MPERTSRVFWLHSGLLALMLVLPAAAAQAQSLSLDRDRMKEC